ncbi:hypothetical protein BC938DRAFT_471766 [Jimgerdemannia flammicorona]|uniref:Uncharacterized protein n=1 Tax=Jimgerdemannia flammicorona TaxID=994334 RepID=A0A433Q7G7_9FUNG|nr:hypothetical protein BC938DRAFT_471766 [Jimgerdemannia flammicorona]
MSLIIDLDANSFRHLSLGGGFKSDSAILTNSWMRARQYKGHVLNKHHTHFGSWSASGYYTGNFVTLQGYKPKKNTPLCPKGPSKP